MQEAFLMTSSGSCARRVTPSGKIVDIEFPKQTDSLRSFAERVRSQWLTIIRSSNIFRCAGSVTWQLNKELQEPWFTKHRFSWIEDEKAAKL